MKPGRNDPCHCGSGKKYKSCHLPIDEAPKPGELVWHRVRRATEGLSGRLLERADAHFGPTGLDEAWDEFNCFQYEDPFDPDDIEMAFFVPWFVYHWLPDPEETEVPESAHGTTIAEAYLKRGGAKLDPLVARYIDAALDAAFSFHEVLSVEPDVGLKLRDIVIDSVVDVFEKTASRDLRVGDIMFARIVPIDDIAVIEGCAAARIEPADKPLILTLKDSIEDEASGRSGVALLRDWEFELRDLYFDIAVGQSMPPALANSDGEPMEFHTLVYDVDSSDDALDELRDLASDVTDEEYDEATVRDTDGNVVSAEIPWTGGDNETLLGVIRFDGRRLSAEVNSAARAERLAALIEERLGDAAQRRPSVIQSAESAFAVNGDDDDDDDDLEEMTPELRAEIAKKLRRTYKHWLDTALPALGDRTPREAVKDRNGREAVEALIADFERKSRAMSLPVDDTLFADLRRELGLD